MGIAVALLSADMEFLGGHCRAAGDMKKQGAGFGSLFSILKVPQFCGF